MHNTYLQQLLQQQNSINNTDTIMVNTYAEGIDKVRRSKVIIFSFSSSSYLAAF